MTRLLGLILVLWTVLTTPGLAAEVSEAQADASLVQTRLWLDMGELAKALAMTRRATALRPDDPRWHGLRLRALHAAGMDPWIEAEYGRPPAAARLPLAVWEAEVGRRLGLPAELGGEAADLARARLALRSGDVSTARTTAASGEGLAWDALRAELHTVTGDGESLAALAARWPLDEDAPLWPLAGLWTLKGGAAKKARRALEEEVDRRVSQARDPLPLLQAAELMLAVGDDARLGAVADALDGLRTEPADLQELIDGFSAGPAGWTAWESPRRVRWDDARLREVGRSLVRKPSPRLPWGRADEVRVMGQALVEALADVGRVRTAQEVAERYVGHCGRTPLADLLIATDRRREGRDLAESQLLSCVGGTDLLPDDDPAGFDVQGQLDRTADAWLRFGRAVDLGKWFEDSALAFGIAARLAPDAEVVALARQRARAAGLATARDGLPTVPTLLAALEEARWMHPASRLDASRARIAHARTAALLDPSPEHLAARATPLRSCLPTMRARCMLELAVAHEAFRRAERPSPSALDRVSDRGAREAADGWLERLREVWFLRKLDLDRILAAERPEVDLAGVLDGLTGVRLGRPMPRFASSGVRAVDLRGRIVVVAFWASWCRPCQAQLSVLDGYARRWAEEGIDVRVLAVNVDEDDEKYRRALGRLSWDTITMLRDPSLRRVFQVEDLPTVHLADVAGVLRDVRSGYGDGDLSWLDEGVRTWASMASRAPQRR